MSAYLVVSLGREESCGKMGSMPENASVFHAIGGRILLNHISGRTHMSMIASVIGKGSYQRRLQFWEAEQEINTEKRGIYLSSPALLLFSLV